MIQYNAKNERVKYRYFERLTYGKESRGKDFRKQSREAIYLFENFIGFKDYSVYNKDVGIAFIKSLLATPSKATGGTLSLSYITHVSGYLENFYLWLNNEPEYRGKIRLNDLTFFHLDKEQRKIAASTEPRKWLEMAKYLEVISQMPFETPVEKRNKAMLVLFVLTGARISALISAQIKHIDIAKKTFNQLPNEVKTKDRKRILTYFFPVDDGLITVLDEYIKFLLGDCGLSLESPLFPMNKRGGPSVSKRELATTCWNQTGSARSIFIKALSGLGFSGYCPHSVRNSLVHHGYDLCKSISQIVAWSQNLGHEDVKITFSTYGYLDDHQRGKLINDMRNKNKDNNDDLLAQIRSIVN
jgi:integrase/recombinase XerD